MSSKADLQRKLRDLGYEIGPFASKETLSNVARLHTKALDNKGVNVSKLNDLDLRKSLTENGFVVGPVTGHTRAIYQRKLLELLTNEISEGQEDDMEINDVISTTPPKSTRNSTIRTSDTNTMSSPGRVYSSDYQEPRIPLTRVDVDDRNSRNVSSYQSNTSQNKTNYSTTQPETMVHSYSPQRPASKPESRPNTQTFGLRNPYDFQNDEPVATRQEHKATPFRATNISTTESFSTNTNRFGRQSEISSTTSSILNSGNDINELRSRLSTTSDRFLRPSDISTATATTTRSTLNPGKDALDLRSRLSASTNEQREMKSFKDVPPSKPSNNDNWETKKSTEPEKINAPAKSGGQLLYAGIAITVALIVFVLYLWFEK